VVTPSTVTLTRPVQSRRTSILLPVDRAPAWRVLSRTLTMLAATGTVTVVAFVPSVRVAATVYSPAAGSCVPKEAAAPVSITTPEAFLTTKAGLPIEPVAEAT
jgi:hypothetical protein